MTANDDRKLGAARKRAGRLAKKLIAASEDFKVLNPLPPCAERDELYRSISLLSAAAMPWLRASLGKKRRSKPRRSFGVTDGWVGG